MPKILGDGSVGLTEFRVDCVNRMAYKSIGDLDAAYNKLLNVSKIKQLRVKYIDCQRQPYL